MVFRFEMYPKFSFSRWDGFGRTLTFKLDNKFPWASVLLNFQTFEAPFLSINLMQDAETLHAYSRGRGRESAVGFKRIRNEKHFSTLLYGMFFLAKSGMSLEIQCCQTVHSRSKWFSDLKFTQKLLSDGMVLEGI